MNGEVEGMLDLKGRSKRCCCKYCGGALVLKRVLCSSYEDGRVELYCPQCQRLEFGVEREIYQCARFFVEVMGYNGYPGLDDNEKTRRMNVARVCEIMAWENQLLGFLGKGGFVLPVEVRLEQIGQTVVFEDEDLLEMETRNGAGEGRG